MYRWLVPTRIIWGVLIIVLLILVSLILGNAALQLYRGFGEMDVWDWLSLTLSILAVAVVGWLLSRSFARHQRDWLVPTRIIWGMLIIVLILLGLVLGYTVLEPYTNFGERRAWDWLQLGGISLAIALVGWLITREQRARGLGDVDLRSADLSFADVRGAKGITNEKLERQASSLEGAIMPNGQKYEDWLENKGHGENGENAGH